MTVKRYYPGMELPKQDNIQVSLGIARKKWRTAEYKRAVADHGCDPKEVNGKPGLEMNMLGSPVSINHPDGEGFFPDGTPLPDFFIALALHYLNSPGGSLKGELITYVQCPTGKVYEGPFNKMTRNVLLATFGDKPELFDRVIDDLGWERVDLGDIACRVYPYPRVPMTFVLYKADEEFDADMQVFFDASIIEFLPEEDIKLSCGMMVGKAKKAAAAIEGEKNEAGS